MKTEIPVKLRGVDTRLTVEYRENSSAEDSGFDALVNLPFNQDCCIGYPILHAFFDNMELTGYKRYCGFIQFVEKREFMVGAKDVPCNRSFFLDVSDAMLHAGVPYFAYGYPAELYDAPCKNLENGDKLIWRAYTYLVDIPSRMNQDRLSYLAGFSWGYTEDVSGPLSLLEFEILSEKNWFEHYSFLKTQCPDFAK